MTHERSVSRLGQRATRRVALRLLAGVISVGSLGCEEASLPSVTSRPHGLAEVGFEGRIFPRRYNQRGDRANGHHAIVWRDGKQAGKALIEADSSDVDIQVALEAIGLVPGDNLSVAAWEDRHDPEYPEPDKHVQGPLLEVLVEWEGSEHPHSLSDLLENTTAPDVQIRFGGHREFISTWKSGCVVCLFSCPGGRTSNAARTLRDQALGRRHFLANESILPPDGTEVRVTLRPVASPEGREEHAAE